MHIVTWLTRNSKKSQIINQIRKVGRRVTWHPPPRGWIKSNVDAFFSAASCKGSIAATFRDEDGKLLTAITSIGDFPSALAAEASALSEAMSLAVNLNVEIIQAIKSNSLVAEIDAYIEDIRDLMSIINDIGFIWVPRKANRLSHEFVRFAVDGEVALGSLLVFGTGVKLCEIPMVISLLFEIKDLVIIVEAMGIRQVSRSFKISSQMLESSDSILDVCFQNHKECRR
ncbi:hypothetical protein PIB30_030212 [Stylosanthes scabra]|uniref:RNase H type-1 domain-containing protein n=1 Tax=Stylosanthes scabra TaxID=79078 RepID=A0ABU6UBU9_9FABA|nr:hypothetical protein [Stylosanthes scabra]